jgi:hypothetical protein
VVEAGVNVKVDAIGISPQRPSLPTA